jgi:hypothetical protein
MRIYKLLLIALFALSACGGVEDNLSAERTEDTSELRSASRSFTIARDSSNPDDFTTPGGPPVVADYKLCCFGDSCTVASGICAFSTWTCTGKTETREGTVYTGCTCTSHCG